VPRAQSSASRLVRNVFEVVGHPVLRMTAFQVLEGVLTMAAMLPRYSAVTEHCTATVLKGAFLRNLLDELAVDILRYITSN
jgi:hypothetical protein